MLQTNNSDVLLLDTDTGVTHEGAFLGQRVSISVASA